MPPQRTRHFTPSSEVAAAFERCGWLQTPPDPKLRSKSKSKYKRGYEARFSVPADDAPRLTRLLESAGFEPGKPYAKGRHVRVPLYGKAQIARLQQLLK